ncbi:hypothetical protein [Halpernia frigidisoli]|uniref:Uncharacterized protein n=1 Tax=Halpernia frigidisoli TaxID=1125876 RepID=A0A1I3FQX3_9FLAO|nr:hypothetical protein [Halpernia frigidisoli]SFI13482.1 hypothetical protein SAMN05443292_1551 [Halpernia frigidisoli]
MAEIKNTKSFMRVTHRYLGFFMAGIMAMYSISGILLIYRDSDFLKKESIIEKNIGKNLSDKDLGKELKIKNMEVLKTEGNILSFKEGVYNSESGDVKYTKKELPLILKKMTNLHKAQSKDRLSLLNVFFGISLFFFVLSSFWMFNVKSKAFRRGMLYTAAGLILSVILIYLS